MSSTLPSTGARFTCTSATFMNTQTTWRIWPLTGSGAKSTLHTRPSAGETTASRSSGVTRSGSRKKCTTNPVATSRIRASSHQPMAAKTRVAKAERPMEGSPSRLSPMVGLRMRLWSPWVVVLLRQ